MVEEIKKIITVHREKLDNLKANREDESLTDKEIEGLELSIQLLASVLSDLNRLVAPYEFVAYLQEWEESERGWGTRPDGCSLHTSEAAHKFYMHSVMDGRGDAVPHEYDRPCGNLTKALLSEDLFNSTAISGGTVRMFQSEYRRNIAEGKIKIISN